MAGVTLLELMAVVVIVAILATIAVPSYRQYTMRAQRTEAKSALLQIAANQQRYYGQNGNSFSAVLADIRVPAVTESDRYALSIDAGADAVSFTARATAINEMTRDADCQQFSIDEQGVRASTPEPDCW
jgi:type IV pilus assembly protein PilE